MKVQPDPLMYKPGSRGALHFLDAFRYSMKGIKAAWRNEAAFRHLAILACLFIPLGYWIAESAVEQALLSGSCLLVLMCEMLNSAIEAVVDRVGTEEHPLSGQAKDLGSAATFFAMLIFLSVWAPLCWSRFF